jgi:hypothetical protein
MPFRYLRKWRSSIRKLPRISPQTALLTKLVVGTFAKLMLPLLPGVVGTFTNLMLPLAFKPSVPLVMASLVAVLRLLVTEPT